MMESPYIQYLPDGTSFPMIWVEGGRFWMGDDDSEYSDEKPAHEVELDAFYMGQYPVTQALWKAVMGADKNPSFFKGDQRPVEKVSWDQIVKEFLPRLNEITQQTRPKGHVFRLPTEAEWEFAARGGLKSQGFLYAGSDQLKNVGWFEGNSHGETKDVGLKQTNELSLFDMSGNVWEWCFDWLWSKFYEEGKKQGLVKNPLGPEQGTDRVVRGGSWIGFAWGCRVWPRFYRMPGSRINYVGFRLVLSPQSVGYL
jgi:formylglycine-generating enzyme required for sulfatase activity